jgi:hypothetical protein
LPILFSHRNKARYPHATGAGITGKKPNTPAHRTIPSGIYKHKLATNIDRIMLAKLILRPIEIDYKGNKIKVADKLDLELAIQAN